MAENWPPELHEQLRHLTQHLVDEFGDRMPRDVIEARTHKHLEQFRDARVSTFVPTLVYRYTREEIQDEIQDEAA